MKLYIYVHISIFVYILAYLSNYIHSYQHIYLVTALYLHVFISEQTTASALDIPYKATAAAAPLVPILTALFEPMNEFKYGTCGYLKDTYK